MNKLGSGDFDLVFQTKTAQTLLCDGQDTFLSGDDRDVWQLAISNRIHSILEHSEERSIIQDDLFIIGRTALSAFLQANVTGPPLTWSPATTILPHLSLNEYRLVDQRQKLISSLAVDGIACYPLAPNIELFSLAKCLLNHPAVINEDRVDQLRFRIRVNAWHQRLLTEVAPSLQDLIYSDLELLERIATAQDDQKRVEFLIERATIHLDHGFDELARRDLTEATQKHKFAFALTGRLGKRTKFQQHDLSQLVVLAKSNGADAPSDHERKAYMNGQEEAKLGKNTDSVPKPKVLNLDDETLLESISFLKESSDLARMTSADSLPLCLKAMDAADQPILDPIDSIILLATASSITNTSPQDGLTREETLPYATRVLSDPSTNWQIYTQALLVRSRIEGYRSRTVERGLLQLQAIVDQVIAETTGSPKTVSQGEGTRKDNSDAATAFFPQPKSSETASVTDRLCYIHLLAPPTRWKLESELADRWISLGGLRSALEIYERLQMWAEVALCWAAQDREDKARTTIRQQLYVLPANEERPHKTEEGFNVHTSTQECDSLPHDAPRLFCILGDLEKSISAYQRAWEVSNQRYARAQRSLGKHYFVNRNLLKADEAYAISLRIAPQSHGTWFALGCVRLQLEDWSGAVEAFTRAIQIEDRDAESWSNLAAALLQLPADTPQETDITFEQTREVEQKHVREAFVALKRAANLKRDTYRIWQNLLQVGLQLSPPPYIDIVIAQGRLIELLGKTQGEKCVDIPVVEGLINHLTATSSTGTISHSQSDGDTEEEIRLRKPGLEKMIINLVQKQITPLITSSRRLWLVNAKLSLHLQRPSAALAAYQKAWRVTTSQPGWDSGAQENHAQWVEVTEATSDLADAYESLGERTRETGMGEGEFVAKDWRFKARSAIRGIIGRAKDSWNGSAELDMLRDKLDGLKIS